LGVGFTGVKKRLKREWHSRAKPFVITAMRRANYVAVKRMWPGSRAAVGVVFCAGGVLGFLPILGFWMLPVGVLFIATEVPSLRPPMLQWLVRQKREIRRYKHDHDER
jgi:hypothetical protein